MQNNPECSDALLQPLETFGNQVVSLTKVFIFTYNTDSFVRFRNVSGCTVEFTSLFALRNLKEKIL